MHDTLCYNVVFGWSLRRRQQHLHVNGDNLLFTEWLGKTPGKIHPISDPSTAINSGLERLGPSAARNQKAASAVIGL